MYHSAQAFAGYPNLIPRNPFWVPIHSDFNPGIAASIQRIPGFSESKISFQRCGADFGGG
ncbi:hypothetical protein AAMO2058_001470100 [Amorphochlora amoebiformis]